MKNIIGATGEYFVAAELSQRGIVATLTLKNAPYIDILASNLLTGQTANIQVKTMSVTNNQGWRLGINDQEESNIKNHYYVFVNLKGASVLPEYIIIPRNVLANFIKKCHSDWLLGYKKDGTTRKDTNIRAFDPYRNKEVKIFAEKYINNWDILNLW